MESVERFSEVPVYVHSNRSIKLAGRPLAEIAPTHLYSGMGETNNATVLSSEKINRAGIYKLLVTLPGVKYKGYSDASEIGKYYAVTWGKETRLYTMVNFLQPKNIKFLDQVFGSNTNSSGNVSLINENSASGYIPLLIKKYEKGRFTKKLLASD